jgi:NADH-quinone oxidoreductase subunit L
MVMSMGIGAYASSLFHLVTHAFFKCLLFLVAGVVIHQMAHIKEDNNLDIDAQDIQNMGGLRKKLPLTFVAAVIGGLALIGLPLSSGYLSKDGILIQTFKWSEHKGVLFNIVPILAVFTTWLTAFYVTRLIVKVFFGKLRILQNQPDPKIHMSDGGWQYKLPLVLLALCCVFPLFSLNPVAFEHAWLFKGLSLTDGSAQESLYNVLVPVAVSIISFAVIFYTYKIYTRPGKSIFQQSGFLYNVSFNAWYFDGIYQKIITRPILALASGVFWFDRTIIDGFIQLLAKTTMALARLSAWTDKYIVDGFLNLLAAIVQSIGNFARGFQGGKVQYYLYSMLAVVVALLILKTVL